MKAPLIFILVLANFYVHGQKFDADDYYKNGKRKYKGKYTSCVVDVVGGVHIYERRKTGKWIYYYSSGGIKRIEYHTKTKSCKTEILKEGKWQYFNEEGELYLEEKYERDTLKFKETPFYNKDQLVGKLTFHNGSIDTLYYIKPIYSKNLIPNSGFETYYYIPVNIINDGQDNIEDIIPYWRSPDNSTPDYYNTNRRIVGIPDHLGNGQIPPEGTGYIGLMTYFHPKNKYDSWDPAKNNIIYGEEYVYSESIQSRLTMSMEIDKKYCFKAKIILSQNAGLSIDKFGVYFSENEVTFKYNDFHKNAQLTFNKVLSNTKEWATLCGVYKSNGNEQFITLGRFAKPGMTNLTINNPIESSELDINKSAYYLLDDLHLFKVSSYEECHCSENTGLKIEKNLTNRNLNYFFNVTSENKVILKNVLFDFDSTNFKNSSFPELNNLYSYLHSNPDINILITGHTDNEGSAEYNKHLSLKRAMSIKSWLVQKGIDPSRISCAGKGFENPVFNNASEQNKSINRRVEFEVIDK